VDSGLEDPPCWLEKRLVPSVPHSEVMLPAPPGCWFIHSVRSYTWPSIATQQFSALAFCATAAKVSEVTSAGASDSAGSASSTAGASAEGVSSGALCAHPTTVKAARANTAASLRRAGVSVILSGVHFCCTGRGCLAKNTTALPGLSEGFDWPRPLAVGCAGEGKTPPANPLMRKNPAIFAR